MKGFSVFETMAEELLEGKLARLLGGRLQLVDIANALARALEDRQSRSPEGIDLAPNRFVVRVSADDFQELAPFLDVLQEQFSAYVTRLAVAMELSVPGSARVAIESSPSVALARARVEAGIELPDDDAHLKPGATRPIRTVPDTTPSTRPSRRR
jgi:hypothetical protein